jgi:hypothetical protein
MNEWFKHEMEDGTPRVFIGVHRPPLGKFLGKGASVVITPGGGTLYSVNQVRDAWNAGTWDIPMYRDPMSSDA